jgi:hypothetical protein
VQAADMRLECARLFFRIDETEKRSEEQIQICRRYKKAAFYGNMSQIASLARMFMDKVRLFMINMKGRYSSNADFYLGQ